MLGANNVRAQIKDHLERQAPLTVVTLDDLYGLPGITVGQRSSVRAAIYGLCAGTPVSERSKPSSYYGIRLKLNSGKQVILSLPGLPREDLLCDHESDNTTDRVIQRLQTQYGIETINYWVKSAQHRSVVQAAKGMKTAKSRDHNECKLCKHEENPNPEPVSACHIISRKALFWKTLDTVEKVNNDIFSEKATVQIQEMLKNTELHSDAKFIVTLCREHNKMLLQALKQSLTQQESEKVSEQENSLF